MRAAIWGSLFAGCVAMAAACGAGDDDDDDDDDDGTAMVAGGVQKGPFILGSQIQVNVLDATGNPTGQVFNTTTTSDKGEFGITLPAATIELVTDGFYYDEATWSLSGAAISMRGVTEVSASSPDAFVNAFTHMTAQRALALIAGGATAADAIAQAESELAAQLPLVAPAGLSAGARMNVLGGDDASNAYLLALSCMVSRAALNEADGTNNDAKLQELINNAAVDLMPDGALEENLISNLRRGGAETDPYECVASLQFRLDELQDTTTVLPDLQQVFDFDFDGTANADDTDADGDGIDASAQGVIAVAATAGAVGLVALDANGGVTQLHRRLPATAEDMYSPCRVSADEKGATPFADVVAIAETFNDRVALLHGNGDVRVQNPDCTASLLTDVPGTATAIAGDGMRLLVVNDAGDAYEAVWFDSTSQIAGVSDAVLIAGHSGRYAYLDSVGDVRIVDGAGTATPVTGLDAVTVVDLGYVEHTEIELTFFALTDGGALYRFTPAAPAAVEETAVTGVTSLRTLASDVPAGIGAAFRLFAITPNGVWNVFGDGTGPVPTPTQIADLPDLAALAGPAQYGMAPAPYYVVADDAGDLQLIEFRDDGTPSSTVLRPLYVPR